jgi:hypothetical protein
MTLVLDPDSRICFMPPPNPTLHHGSINPIEEADYGPATALFLVSITRNRPARTGRCYCRTTSCTRNRLTSIASAFPSAWCNQGQRCGTFAATHGITQPQLCHWFRADICRGRAGAKGRGVEPEMPAQHLPEPWLAVQVTWYF